MTALGSGSDREGCPCHAELPFSDTLIHQEPDVFLLSVGLQSTVRAVLDGVKGTRSPAAPRLCSGAK